MDNIYVVVQLKGVTYHVTNYIKNVYLGTKIQGIQKLTEPKIELIIVNSLQCSTAFSPNFQCYDFFRCLPFVIFEKKILSISSEKIL